MTPPKAAKGWALIGSDGDIWTAYTHDSKPALIEQAVRYLNESWADLERQGFRALPCTITVSEDER